eukprot:4366650-Pleurochrysis_carterae.AAC.2
MMRHRCARTGLTIDRAASCGRCELEPLCPLMRSTSPQYRCASSRPFVHDSSSARPQQEAVLSKYFGVSPASRRRRPR